MSTTNVGAAVISGSQATSSSGGLGSGIDVSQLVQSALADQDAELSILQGQQSQITTEQNDLNSFNTDLQTLSSAVFALTDPAGDLTSTAATSSNSSVVTATASGGAAIGNHSVVVNSLATTASQYSNAVASSSTTIPTGTLSIQVGSATPTQITIDSNNNTLDGLAAAINSSNAGVTANVITDANGARLALVSNTSGAAGGFAVTGSGGGLTFTNAVTAQNGSITVDGVPIATTSNTVSTAIAGVTLNLVSASPNQTVSVATTPDTTTQAADINSFVSAYNTVVTDLNSEFAVNASTGEPGPGAADSTLALAQSQILSTISFTMTGNGNVNSLADLGITMNNDGTLSVDSSTLSAALAANPTAVQNFFSETGAGSFGQNLTNQINAIADPLTGSVAQDIAGLQQSQTAITQQISDFQDQLSDQQTQLTTEYDAVDTTLQELPLLLQQTQQQLASL